MITKRKSPVALLVALAAWSVAVFVQGATASAANTDLAVGQEWSIKSKSPTTAKLIIGGIEPWHGKVVVQVSVIDVLIPPGAPGAGHKTTIDHMPFEKSAIIGSVDRLLATGVPPAPNFESGYKRWRADAKAGIYTIDVAQAIQTLFEALSRSRT